MRAGRRVVTRALLALAITGGAIMGSPDAAGAELPTDRYGWSEISSDAFADNLRMALAGHPAAALPAPMRQTCRVGVSVLATDPLIPLARIVVTLSLTPDADPAGFGDYVVYDGPVGPTILADLPVITPDYSGETTIRAFVADGLHYMDWKTFGTGRAIRCDGNGSIMTLLADFDMAAGGRTLRIDDVAVPE
jgi:hypothetical protein